MQINVPFGEEDTYYGTNYSTNYHDKFKTFLFNKYDDDMYDDVLMSDFHNNQKSKNHARLYALYEEYLCTNVEYANSKTNMKILLDGLVPFFEQPKRYNTTLQPDDSYYRGKESGGIFRIDNQTYHGHDIKYRFTVNSSGEVVLGFYGLTCFSRIVVPNICCVSDVFGTIDNVLYDFMDRQLKHKRKGIFNDLLFELFDRDITGSNIELIELLKYKSVIIEQHLKMV